MALTVVGVNHRGASLEIRERLAYRASEIGEVLDELREESAAREIVLLSTCNRTEVYLVESGSDAAPAVWRAFSARLGLSIGVRLRPPRSGRRIAPLSGCERAGFDGARRGTDSRPGARRLGAMPRAFRLCAESALPDIAVRRRTRAQ